MCVLPNLSNLHTKRWWFASRMCVAVPLILCSLYFSDYCRELQSEQQHSQTVTKKMVLSFVFCFDCQKNSKKTKDTNNNKQQKQKLCVWHVQTLNKIYWIAVFMRHQYRFCYFWSWHFKHKANDAKNNAYSNTYIFNSDSIIIISNKLHVCFHHPLKLEQILKKNILFDHTLRIFGKSNVKNCAFSIYTHTISNKNIDGMMQNYFSVNPFVTEVVH